MKELLLVGSGGFLGACSRYGLGLLLGSRDQSSLPFISFIPFPWAILLANVAGCFLIGLLFSSQRLGKGSTLFLTTGLLGGFTTFSSFGLDTLRLWQNGQTFSALGNISANLGLGLLGVTLGFIVGSSLKTSS